MPRTLVEGLYEHLLTRGLDAELSRIAGLRIQLDALDEADLPTVLSRHLAAEVTRALRDAKSEAKQLEIAHGLLARLAELAPEVPQEEVWVAPPARMLRSIYRTAPPVRPVAPLAETTLLTRSRSEPALVHELASELGSADEVEILAAFVTMGGVRALRDALEDAVRRRVRIRVLTTVFTGTTEVDAVDALARLPGVEVRVSFDVRRTRLHAKAWLFRRASGLHTAYVGSANFTATALGTGHEWMVKVCSADLPQVIEKFEGTFEGLWNDPEFEPYDPDSLVCRRRLAGALRTEQVPVDAKHTFFSLRPFPFQEEILDQLAAERAVHGRTRNLVVAATGTGKTVIAAFDYLRLCEAEGLRPRMLFLAHRRELLDQALATYRQVLRDGAFGESWYDDAAPVRWDHVFATVQTAARTIVTRVHADHFAIVVVDECHHAPADSYRRVLDHLRPQILLGLTATPERTDERSLLPDFDGRVAAELRLWHALERQLLVPFEYFGIADTVDLSQVRWTRRGYVREELSALYTGHEARVDLILEQLRRRVADVRTVRALAFCVSVEHAEFMARALSARGVPAIAVHGGTPDDERVLAPKRLREREVNVVCTCDLYNEGVDLPFVDTLLLLRPTESATLFMQQLGRGLRLDAGKSSCLVLDFIGQHRSEFRFDGLYAALTGIPRGNLVKELRAGFPFLPSGCALQLDAVAAERVLAGLKRAVANRATLARELRDLAAFDGEVTLARFLEHTGRDVEDVYGANEGWTGLCARAGLSTAADAEALEASRRLARLTHVDEASRLRLWTEPVDAARADPLDRCRFTMIDFQLHERGIVRDPAETAAWLHGNEAIRGELAQLAAVLRERIVGTKEERPVPDWPIALHRHYGRREIMAAIGYARPGKKGATPQGGILKLSPQRREILLVTLDKSASSFSPTTRYKDYAISRTLFHWETQSAASVSRDSGRRYLESPDNGWTFFLFVRTDRDAPYAFLGPVQFRSARGDRPIGITWELEHPMPAALFDRFATLAQG